MFYCKICLSQTVKTSDLLSYAHFLRIYLDISRPTACSVKPSLQEPCYFEYVLQEEMCISLGCCFDNTIADADKRCYMKKYSGQ